METTNVIIARLVLGYLKEEKCRKAYKAFQATSESLQNDNSTRSKYSPTRFIGLTLTDILNEYFEISRIVQGRLESTNYYNERHMRVTLVQQLLYLLNKVQSIPSRTSTPYQRSPESNTEDSPSGVDQVSDVETTQINSLPGNKRCISEDSYLHKTPRKRAGTKLSKSATNSNLKISAKDSEVLTHTLLENKELHEKIAQTINKVAEKQSGGVCSELNRTIKTVVQETEADPIFDRILEEIIGASTTLENAKETESSSTTSSTHKDARDESINQTGPQNQSNPQNSDEEHNGNIQNPNPCRVEEQNEEAIRSIVASSTSTDNPQVPGPSIPNNDVTVFNGSLDKYLISNTCNAIPPTQPVQNPLYIDTSRSLLVVPSAITSGRNLHLDSSKQYYVVNKQPALNWGVPTNVLTEQDILSMPTVIVSDDTHNKAATTQQAPVSTPAIPNLLPKPIIEVPAEYMYTGKDVPQQQSGLKNVIYPKSTKKVPAKRNCPKPPIVRSTVTIQASSELTTSKSLPEDKLDEEFSDKAVNAIQSNNKNDNIDLTTPSPERVVQKAPRSGSHVRNLDFSSPPRITSTHKKSSRRQTNTGRKSSPFVHKKQAAKALFSTRKPSTEEERKKKAWDADLRASLAISDTEGNDKRIKRSPGKKSKRRLKTGKWKKKLNSTDNNAALIEAALETPVKSEREKCSVTDDIDHEGKTETEASNKEGNSGDTNKAEREVESNENKMVISPSKLNANIRTVIGASPDETNKYLTPETTNEIVQHPIKANRNITSLFETPLKNDVLPKTPGHPSPNATLTTPFTKMLEANLKGLDISSLPTPNIPITPNFPPFTPNVDLTSPYSNRPTDYSTTSSYYQPSDSEPNRSLEANIIELEKQPVKVLSDVVVATPTELFEDEPKPVKSVDVRLKIFNGSVIGKKNLSLVKRDVESSSSSSSESSSESSSDENSASEWMEKSNETVIYNKKNPETPKRMYCLRSAANVKKEEAAKTSEVKESPSKNKTAGKGAKTNARRTSNADSEPLVCDKAEKTNSDEENKTFTKKDAGSKRKVRENSLKQAGLKKELTEKLQRTLKEIKKVEKPVAGKATKKPSGNSKGHFMKIKLGANKAKSRKKAQTPKKNAQKGPTRGANKSNNRDMLSRSRSNDRTKKGPSPLLVKDAEKTDKSASDIEAQNLIEGLKERGIHLMKNKTSPCKKDNTASKDSVNNVLERSSSELETEWRETYDIKSFPEEHECIVFKESKHIRSLKTYELAVLEKTFVGKVFVEGLNKEVDIPLVVSPFYTLLDISPKQNTAEESDKKSVEKTSSRDSARKTESNKSDKSTQPNPVSEDNIKRNAVRTTKEHRDSLEAPSLKKRKVEKEDTRLPEEKECKTLLQKINVDTFLNNIYGNS